MSDHLARAQLVKLDIDALVDEAKRCGDPGRIAQINDEVDVRLESLRQIRREQLMEQLEPPQKPRKRWWQFWKPAQGTVAASVAEVPDIESGS